MRILIELEKDFGHPDNRPTKQYILEAVNEQLPKMLEKGKSGFFNCHLVAVRVE